MNWVHKCSLDWLKGRQHHLTASDVRSLVPVTKAGRERKVTDDERLKVLASKLVELTEDDCMSYGVMARGHIMEPYALMLLKNEVNHDVYWWDDTLISKSDVEGSLAFSPDGLDVPMGGNPCDARVIYEVKSYTPERHLSTAFTPKGLIEERWQIATAMAVLPGLTDAWLVLFCPKLTSNRMYAIHWKRDELACEIASIHKAEDEWLKFLDRWHYDCEMADWVVTSSGGFSESEIIERETPTMSAMWLNP